jgi:glucokinase
VGHFASPYAFHGGTAVACVCGGAGHVEAIASGPAIRETYLRLGGDSPAVDARAVFALAGASDATAIQAVGMGAAAAGQAVGGLANILDPEVVVVSGGLSDAGAPWWRPMERALRAELLPALAGLPVLPAKLGNAAAIAGAARLVLTPQPSSTALPPQS